MPRKKKSGLFRCTALSTLIAVMGLAISSQALADMNFCNGCANKSEGRAKNTAEVVVTKVKIDQESSDECDHEEMEHSGNLLQDDSFQVIMNGDCSYHFKFDTTSDCKGEKAATVRLSDHIAGTTTVVMHEQCGKLKTSKYK